MFALLTLIGALAGAPAALPPAHYKSTCTIQGQSPLFVGQALFVYGPHGTPKHNLEPLLDIHWLTFAHDSALVGYIMTGEHTHDLSLMPFEATKVFKNPFQAGPWTRYIPLGKIPMTSAAITRALYKNHLVAAKAKGRAFEVHACFSDVWNGTYPPGS